MLFSSDSEVYFGVNPVGAIIWELLPTCDTVEELCATLASRFSDVGLGRIQKDVMNFLSDLRANGLVVETPPKRRRYTCGASRSSKPYCVGIQPIQQ